MFRLFGFQYETPLFKARGCRRTPCAEDWAVRTYCYNRSFSGLESFVWLTVFWSITLLSVVGSYSARAVETRHGLIPFLIRRLFWGWRAFYLPKCIAGVKTVRCSSQKTDLSGIRTLLDWCFWQRGHQCLANRLFLSGINITRQSPHLAGQTSF